jgi:hypothetical protein
MNPVSALLVMVLQTSPFHPPVTVRCEIDTELPLHQIHVSVAEQPEKEAGPDSEGHLTLARLPEGNLHLSFFQEDEHLGEVAVRSAQSGDFIRLRVRLVPGNAILLDEFRVKGVSETGTSIDDDSDASQPPLHAPQEPSSSGESALSNCPAPGEPFSRTGNVTRVIDHEAFEFQTSDRKTYVIYVGTATRLQRGTGRMEYADLHRGLRLLVKGTVAAGPHEECSIGAREITVQNQ